MQHDLIFDFPSALAGHRRYGNWCKQHSAKYRVSQSVMTEVHEDLLNLISRLPNPPRYAKRRNAKSAVESIRLMLILNHLRPPARLWRLRVAESHQSSSRSVRLNPESKERPLDRSESPTRTFANNSHVVHIDVFASARV